MVVFDTLNFKGNAISFVSGMIVVFTVWTAMHSSLWTVSTFIDSQEKADECRRVMKEASLVTLGTAGIVYLLFRNVWASGSIVFWTVVLYWMYESRVREAGF